MSLTGLAFVAAFFGVMGLALFRHPMWGLYGYVAVFYLHPPSRWWGAALPDLRWALLAAAVTLIATWRVPRDTTRPSWISHTPAKLLLAYTVWLWIQKAWALSPSDQTEISILFTKYVVLFYLIYRLVDTPQKVTTFLATHVLGCAYLGWLAYNARVHGRLEGVGGPGIDEANALAMQMSTGVAVAAMLILGAKGWVRWACFAAMPFMLNTMVLAGSRGAFVALLGTGLALWYMKPLRHRRVFYAYAVLGAVLLGLLANQIFLTRVGTIAAVAEKDAEVDRSSESRVVLFKAQLQMAKRYPFGTGHRGTAVLSPQYLDPIYLSSKRVDGRLVYGQRSSHNTFMSALVEQGVIGAFLFLSMWWWVLRSLMRLKRTYASDKEQTDRQVQIAVIAAAVGGALAAVFVAGQFVDYLKAEVTVWCTILLACLLSFKTGDSTSKVAASVPGASVPGGVGALR
jgi:O-antigen ligase/polysaccharide polymerase Wzy-like membrane protein